jgi:hypothetical protein
MTCDSTEPGVDDTAGILAGGAVIFLVQGVVWVLGLFFVTTLQLELLYPYVTVTVLAWLGIIPAINFALAAWSGILSLMAKVGKHVSKYMKPERIVFALCSWIAIPFGPIISAWRLAAGREKRVDQDPRTGTNDVLVASLTMFYVTGSLIAVLLIGVPIIIDASVIDLAYPYITPRMLPWFTLIGIYYIALVAGDIFLSIICKAKHVDLFTELPNHEKIACLGRVWLIAHLIALPIGPFLAALAAGARKKEK